jgi:hypothetical protein
MAIRILLASGIDGNRVDMIFENSKAIIEKAFRRD